MNRPEILNRIGDNILIFDFIRSETASAIFENMFNTVLSDVAVSQGIAVSLDDCAHSTLRNACLNDLSNGGRGIRNKVESLLINPLARALFDSQAAAGSQFVITELAIDTGGVTRLRIAASQTEGA